MNPAALGAAGSDISEQQVREFKEAFGFFNSQNSRDTELTVDEIFDVIAKFETAQPGKEVLPKEVEALIREVDTDDTGTVDFPKFLKIMARTSQSTDSLTDQDDTMREAFQFFCDVNAHPEDEPQDSFTEAELERIMDLMGENMTSEEFGDMMQFLDPDSTGRVTYDDFMEVMRKI